MNNKGKAPVAAIMMIAMLVGAFILWLFSRR